MTPVKTAAVPCECHACQDEFSDPRGARATSVGLQGAKDTADHPVRIPDGARRSFLDSAWNRSALQPRPRVSSRGPGRNTQRFLLSLTTTTKLRT